MPGTPYHLGTVITNPSFASHEADRAPDDAAEIRCGCRDFVNETVPTPMHIEPDARGPLADMNVLLAPLCGITDSVFRKICLDHGADMAVTEMISSEGLVRNSNQVRAVRGLDMSHGPLSLQIFGNDADVMSEAAAVLSDLKPRYLDMNFGCPVRKIVSKSGGSAMLGLSFFRNMNVDPFNTSPTKDQ